MRYIRTENGVFELCEKQKYKEQWQVKVNNLLVGYRVVNKDRVINTSDNIEDLIQVGDLVKIADLGTQYPYYEDFAVVTKLFMPHHTAIYRVMELYIKQENGDWHLVAKEKGNCKLELI